MKARSTPEVTVRLRFQGRLLGRCVLHYNGRLIPEASFRRRRSLFLLLQLLLIPNHRLTRDQVLDLLWPDAEPEAAARTCDKDRAIGFSHDGEPTCRSRRHQATERT